MEAKTKIALIQLFVSDSKEDNLKRALELIHIAAENKAKIVSLPEFFNHPISFNKLKDYSENIPDGETTIKLSKAAKENQIYLIGGSIAEKDGSKVYNTCPVFAPDGSLIVKHRKLHLFDVEIPGKISFHESNYIFPGNRITVVNTEYGKIGIGICHDIRFAELAALYKKENCSMLFYPGAFEPITGSAHWELLIRTRAVDSLCYVLANAPARNTNSEFKLWAHSTVADPSGKVIAKAGSNQEIIYAYFDKGELSEARRKFDYENYSIFETVSKNLNP